MRKPRSCLKLADYFPEESSKCETKLVMKQLLNSIIVTHNDLSATLASVSVLLGQIFVLLEIEEIKTFAS